MADSDIEWTDVVWNVTRGCRRVSSGCGGPNNEGGCYAERQAYRFSGEGQPYEGLVTLSARGPRWTGKGYFATEKLGEPLRWRKPRRVFVNSMSDLFFEAFSNEQIAAVFGVMAASQRHTFQILTKRPERAVEWFQWYEGTSGAGASPYAAAMAAVAAAPADAKSSREWFEIAKDAEWPLPNVHLGVSVENQETADERIPLLLQCPAAVRWISAEPLLGAVNLTDVEWCQSHYKPDLAMSVRAPEEPELVNALTGSMRDGEEMFRVEHAGEYPRLDWVVVGGESGPGARPFEIDWARSLVRQCRSASVPVFVKQLGSNVRDRNDVGFSGEDGDEWDIRGDIERVEHDPEGIRNDYQGAPVRVRLDARKGGDMSEWPEDLRVREFPAPKASAAE